MSISVHVEGLGHGGNPIPTGSRRGPLLATGGVRGVDRTTGDQPAEPAAQVRLAFDNLRAVLDAGEASTADVVHVTVYVHPDAASEVRPPMNEEWILMFPDPNHRPARHLLEQELPAGMLVQLEALAYVAGDAHG